MTTQEFLTALIARRDALCARHAALLSAGDRFAAEDVMADIRFAVRQVADALGIRHA